MPPAHICRSALEGSTLIDQTVRAFGSLGARRRPMTVEPPSFHLQTVCIDCADAHVMADFYGRLLGWTVVVSEPTWVLMRDPAGGTGLSFQAESGYREPTWPEQAGSQDK